MGLLDNLRNGIVNWLNSGMTPEDEADKARAEGLLDLRAYAAGIHKPQMRVKPGGADDNIALNLVGLVVDRAVSRLFGAPITFDLPGEGESKQGDVLAEIWDANRQAIFLHKTGQFGAWYGTCFVKIVPEGVESRKTENKLLPRLVALSPLYMKMTTDPMDMERVLSYTMEFQFVDAYGKTERHREVTEKVTAGQMIAKAVDGAAKKAAADYGDDNAQAIEEAKTVAAEEEKLSAADHWTVTHFVNNEKTGGKWRQEGDPEIWKYEFAPILAWQNMPLADSCYGQSDIEGVLEIQDRINFTEGNISKIVRNHAHPRTWGKGTLRAKKDALGKDLPITFGPDEIVMFQGEQGELHNLEMQSDLASSRAFGLDLRQTLFDVTRTVDTTTIVDKIGTITNLGLRLIYKDELDKLESKRNMYGEALVELNHRLLVMSGLSGPEADGGVVVWPDPLPVDEAAKAQELQAQLNMGLVSKETAAGELGRDWEAEQERMNEQAVAGGNVGNEILKLFTRGS